MNVVDEVKQKLDIVDVLTPYVQLHPSGKNFKANCPFHTEKTASFFVFPERQSWHCFGACGTGGDIFTFIMKKEGLDFGQALRLLAEKANVTLSYKSEKSNKEEQDRLDRLYKINEVAAEYFHYLLLHSGEAEKARNYAEKRGLSSKVIDDFQLGFAPNKWDDLSSHLAKSGYLDEDMLAVGLVAARDSGGHYDRFRNRLIFPLRDIKSRVIGFGARALDDSLPKYLNSPETLIFNKSSVVYAIDRAQAAIRQKDAAVITEGYMDVIAAHQFGYENTVACMGTAITEKQISILRRFSKNIIVALDADLAGLEATTRSIITINEQIPRDYWMPWTDRKTYDELVKYEVQVVEIKGGKDPDEIIRKSPEQWGKLLQESQPIIDFTLKKELANVDQNSPGDKSAFVSKFLPILAPIDVPARRAHYIQKIATLLKMDYKRMHEDFNNLLNLEKKGKTSGKNKVVRIYEAHAESSRPIEEYCLALLLQFPDLKPAGMKLSTEYFEHEDNKDILFKWQENADADSIAGSLDPAIHDYFDHFLAFGRQLPPSLSQSKREREYALYDCINRLQERHVKNLEIKKKLILIEEKEKGDSEGELAKLKELGINGSQQLNDTFRKRRRFFSRTKGV
ncbi:MAG: DNA primase [Dehalococcoidia bacterium]|jgi:DNA primase